MFLSKLIRSLTRSQCPKGLIDHHWEDRYLGSKFYHHGSLGRRGKICRHCAKVVFPETDQEFFNSLPPWLRREIADQDPSRAEMKDQYEA